ALGRSRRRGARVRARHGPRSVAARAVLQPGHPRALVPARPGGGRAALPAVLGALARRPGQPVRRAGPRLPHPGRGTGAGQMSRSRVWIALASLLLAAPCVRAAPAHASPRRTVVTRTRAPADTRARARP